MFFTPIEHRLMAQKYWAFFCALRYNYTAAFLGIFALRRKLTVVLANGERRPFFFPPKTLKQQ